MFIFNQAKLRRDIKLVIFFVTALLQIEARAIEVNFDTDFADKIRAQAHDNTAAAASGYLWPFSGDEMNDAFIVDLKALVTLAAAREDSISSRIITLNGILSGQSISMPVKVNAKRAGSAASVRNLQVNIKNTDRETSLSAAENDARYTAISSSNWSTVRRSLPVRVNNSGVKLSLCGYKRVSVYNSATDAVETVTFCPDGNTHEFNFASGTPYGEIRPDTFINRIGALGAGWRLHMLNVNSGNCAVLLCLAGGAADAMIFDCGETTKGKGSSALRLKPAVSGGTKFDNYVTARVRQILREANVQNIDLVISHVDRDHTSNLELLARETTFTDKIRNVYLGGSLKRLNFDDGGLYFRLTQIFRQSQAATGTGTEERRLFAHKQNIADGSYVNHSPRTPTAGPGPSLSVSAAKGFTSNTENNLPGGDTGVLNWTEVNTSLQNHSGACNGKVKFLAANEEESTGKAADKREKDAKVINGRSIIAQIDNRVVLTADATKKALDRAAAALDSDVTLFTVPHHGSRVLTHRPGAWMTKALAQAKQLVYQAGDDHGHPEMDTWIGSVTGYKIKEPPAPAAGEDDFTNISERSFYSNSTQLIGLGVNKDVYFGNAAQGNNQIQANNKVALETGKAVYVTSDTGELVITAGTEEGSTDIKCVGPFAFGGGNRRLAPGATYDQAKALNDNNHCIPPAP
jgi:beta-lactamase superfamily II metal-dependent hydrolase